MPTIVCSSEDFGFGPISKLLTITEQLNGFTKVFLGKGTALELAKLHDFDECIEFENHQLSFSILSKAISRVDLFLNVMNFPLISLRDFLHCPQYFIDTLFWMWSSLPVKKSEMQKIERYYCQGFVGIETKFNYYQRFLSNLELVGPIVNTSYMNSSTHENKCIINFGGLNNRFITIGKNSNYPFLILDAISHVIQKFKFDRIIITGSSAISQKVSEAKYNLDYEYKTLDHKSFLQELSSAKCLVTSPGLETPYEAFIYGIPVFFLPEQHNSQVFQLQAFAESNVAPFRCSWKEIFPEFNLRLGDFESQAPEIEMVLGCIERFEETQAAKKILQEKLENFLSAQREWPDVIDKQKGFMNSIGPDGSATIVQQIHSDLF